MRAADVTPWDCSRQVLPRNRPGACAHYARQRHLTPRKVVEHGYLNEDPAQEDPSSATAYKQHLLYNLTAVPQPGLNGRANLTVFAAAVVGGGSTINGLQVSVHGVRTAEFRSPLFVQE